MSKAAGKGHLIISLLNLYWFLHRLYLCISASLSGTTFNSGHFGTNEHTTFNEKLLD